MFDCISRVPIRPTSYFSLLYHHAGLYVGKTETFSLTDWIRWRYITFNSEDEIQWCDHLYEPSSLRSTLTWYYLLFYILQNKIWKFVEFWPWPLLTVKGLCYFKLQRKQNHSVAWPVPPQNYFSRATGKLVSSKQLNRKLENIGSKLSSLTVLFRNGRLILVCLHLGR